MILDMSIHIQATSCALLDSSFCINTFRHTEANDLKNTVEMHYNKSNIEATQLSI